MAQVQEILDAQRTMEASLASRMDIYEKSLKMASGDNKKPALEELSADFKNFQTMVWSLLKAMRSQIQALLIQVDDIDTYNRRNALLFSGIPENDSEDCTMTILNVVNSVMNLGDIDPNTIQLCHRLGARKPTGCRPILVRFTSIKVRNHIWREKKRLKSSTTVISEFLTRTKQAVFSATRLHFGIRGCWTRDGAVFTKLPNNDRKRVSSLEELDVLRKKYPAASPTSLSNSPNPASQPQPGPSTSSPLAAAAHGRLPPPPATRKAGALAAAAVATAAAAGRRANK